jgi:hypothetical protein
LLFYIFFSRGKNDFSLCCGRHLPFYCSLKFFSHKRTEPKSLSQRLSVRGCGILLGKVETNANQSQGKKNVNQMKSTNAIHYTFREVLLSCLDMVCHYVQLVIFSSQIIGILFCLLKSLGYFERRILI